MPTPEPILGYTYQQGHLTVYVQGTMAPELCAQEVLLVAQLPVGIREIDLTDCRREFRLLLPQAA